MYHENGLRTFTSRSHSVDEIWALVTQQLNLTVVLALNPMITLALLPFLVLADEQEVCNDAPNAQEERQVSEYHAVTRSVLWRVFLHVDVACDDSCGSC